MAIYSIGLRRGDVYEKIALPPHVNPTEWWWVEAHAKSIIKSFEDAADWKWVNVGEDDYIKWQNSKGDSLIVASDS